MSQEERRVLLVLLEEAPANEELVNDDDAEECGAGDDESCHTDIGEDRYVDDEAEEET